MLGFEVFPVYLNGEIFWICQILPFSIFFPDFFHKNANISKSIWCVLKASSYAFIWVSALSHRCDIPDRRQFLQCRYSPFSSNFAWFWATSPYSRCHQICKVAPMWKSWHSNESIWTGLQHTPDAFADIHIFVEKMWDKDGKRQNFTNSKNSPIQIHRDNFKVLHIWSSVKFCRTPV